MNNLTSTLLRAAISTSLSDREAFIQKVAGIIEQKVVSDPQAAETISEHIATAMESVSESMLIEQLLKPQKNNELEEKIDKLTLAIEKLNNNLEKQWK